MKKRIFALLTAMVMLLSVFVLSSCEDEDGNKSDTASNNSTNTSSTASGDDTSKDIAKITAKELFELSFKNTFSANEDSENKDEVIPEIPYLNLESKDYESALAVKVNKLTLDGTDYVGANPISLNLKTLYDITLGENADPDIKMLLDGDVSVLGDTLPFEAVFDNGNFVITDLMGLNDKGIILDTTNSTSDTPDFGSIMSNDKYAELVEVIKTAFKAAIDANITDNAYTNENKDVTVDGVEFKSADVITLTVSADAAKGIVKSIIDALKENDTAKQLLGEEFFGEDGVKAEDLNVTLIKFSITVANEKIVAMDLVIDAMVDDYTIEDDFGFDFGALEDTSDESFEFNFDAVDGEEDIPQIPDTLTLSASFVNNAFKLHFAPSLNEKEAVIDIIATYNEADGALLVKADVTKEKETYTAFKLEGTCKDNKFNGKMVLDIEGNGAALDFAYESDGTNAKTTITSLVITTDGTSITLPVEIVVDEVYGENKNTADVTIKLEALGNIVDIEMAIVTEIKDVTVNAVNLDDCIHSDEIDDETSEAWGKKLLTLYPNIARAIYEMSGMQGVAAPDYEY